MRGSTDIFFVSKNYIDFSTEYDLAFFFHLDNKPNAAALAAAQQLIACSVEQGKLSTSYKLVGHRQSSSTECPGNSLYAEIQNWPNWTANP